MAGKISLLRTCFLDLKISRLFRERRLSASMGGRRPRRAEGTTRDGPSIARLFTHVGALIIGGLLVFLFLSRDSVLLSRSGVAVSGGMKVDADPEVVQFEGGGEEPDPSEGVDRNVVWDVRASVTDGGAAEAGWEGFREGFKDESNLPRYKPYTSHLWQIEPDRRAYGASEDGRFQNQRLSGRELGLEDVGIANGVRKTEKRVRGSLVENGKLALEQVYEPKRSKSLKKVKVVSEKALDVQRNAKPWVAKKFVEEEGTLEARERLRRQNAFVVAGGKIGLDEGRGEGRAENGWKDIGKNPPKDRIHFKATAASFEASSEAEDRIKVRVTGSKASQPDTFIAGLGWFLKPKGEVPDSSLEGRYKVLGSLNDEGLVDDVNVPGQQILGDVNGPQHNRSQMGSGFLKDDGPLLANFVNELSQPIQIQKLRPAKIAFMFLANGSIHTDRIWDRFFKGAPGEDYYSVYIHR
jgi:hypothetical protein